MNRPYIHRVLRALHGRGALRMPNVGREASRPYNRNHRSGDLYPDHQPWIGLKTVFSTDCKNDFAESK
jgi:hypothetical protein